MKTSTLSEIVAGGVDQRLVTPRGSARSIVNMRLDRADVGWINDRGWEPMHPPQSYPKFTPEQVEPIYSLFVWTKHQGAEVYILTEQNGTLSHTHGNPGTVSATTPIQHILQYERVQPKSDDPGTQYAPFGNMLLILNGHDRMLKFRGGKRVEPFGFTSKPPSPVVFQPDPTYYSGAGNKNASGTIPLRLTNRIGLGKTDLTLTTYDTNRFYYRVSYITNTGSESPMSEPVIADWGFEDEDERYRYGVMLRDIPTGPRGTMARRVYRTKNLNLIDDAAQAVYYFVSEIRDNVTTDFVDVVPDSDLVTLAPSALDSSIVSNTYKYAVVWNDRMWLAGGAGTGTKLIYSQRGAVEQFPTFNSFEVGVREGGDITGVYSYFNTLIVMRERAIDFVISNQDGTQFNCTTLVPQIGTTATNTVKMVPGYGLVFLSYDGLYRIMGVPGASSASQTVENIGHEVQKELKRVSLGALARSTGSYSAKEQEYWVHYPVDGDSKPTRGTVLHLDRKQFSFRNDNGTATPGSFRFNAIATHPRGWFLLAPETITVGTGVLNQIQAYNVGVQVWSALRTQGRSYILNDSDGFWVRAGVVFGDPLTATYASAWEAFGDNSVKKRPLSVEIQGKVQGNLLHQIGTGADWKPGLQAGDSVAIANPEDYGTAQDDAIYGPIVDVRKDRSVAKTSASYWTDDRLQRTRWDVNAGLISSFLFELSGTYIFSVVSYQIEYRYGARKAINTSAGSR